MLKIIKYLTVIFILVSLQGCVRLIMPTSDTELMARSINGGINTTIDINYIQAYSNLKDAYNKCVAFQQGMEYLLINSNLDREKGVATFYGELPWGAYMFKTTLEPVGENLTKLTYYGLKTVLLTKNANQKLLYNRLELDKNRALGLDKKCNSSYK